jgi:uncharacterized membrane protein
MIPLFAHAAGSTGGYGDNWLFTPWEIHPATVHFPIAFLIGGVLLDLWAMRRPGSGLARIATGLLVTGVITGLFVGLAGLLAFFTLPESHTEASHNAMYWHLGIQVVALLLFAGVCWARWGAAVPGIGARVVGWVATVLLVVGSAFGGWIVYHGGAGIDADLMRPHLHEMQSPPGSEHEHPDTTESEHHHEHQ